MVVIVTRDVPDRFRGFLASCMLEIGPGVYTAPRMNPGVRERVRTVMTDWYASQRKGSIVMTWRDPASPTGQSICVWGCPPVQIIERDGVYLAFRP